MTTSPDDRPARPTGGPGTVRRPADRRRSSAAARVGMLVFAVGVLAIVADVVLFATGSRNLPLWLNLVAMLAPVGLAIGLVGVYLENRGAAARRAAGRAG
ncbi:hypothetical protein [Nakamurella endophytica]|uniref:Uncharacterized protein n=1 Tax=Nakamurella endophytica TaxID=1748367 RepID=A0A917SNA1_9ACTN|nr:hypothetical protein [Nakamurella endophytica]GGL88747.1 hypothetical protein GCM10011594_05480 [Nakamurella endophytica]